MLDSFFTPASIAIIGASHTPGKVGYEIFSNIMKSGYKGKIYPVNPNVTSILGIVSYKTVRDIESSVDLAIVAVPVGLVLDVVTQCVEKRVKSIIVVSGGFSETGEKGKKTEKQLKDLLAKTGTRIIGPNVLGIYDSYNNLNTIFLPKERMKMPEKGQISIIAQSGAVGSTVMDLLGEHRMGISKFISYGNATDINESDLICYLGTDPNTKIISAFIEGVKDGKRFINTVKEVIRKKPIIVLKGGKTEHGAKAAASHTGSMAGSYKVYSSVFKQLGITEAKTWEEFLDYSKAFLQPLPKGDRIAVLTDGGGFGVLTSDEAEKVGLHMPEPSEKLKKIIAKDIGDIASLHNPIDLVGDTTAERYRRVMDEVLKSGEYDGIIAISMFQVPTLETTVVDSIDSMRMYGKPIIVFSTGSDFSIKLIKSLESKGIPVYDSPERAVRAMGALVSYSKFLQKK